MDESTQNVDASGQLGLVEILRDHAGTADAGLSSLEEALNPEIDANPDDKLLMELFDYVTDARDSLGEARRLLDTIQARDEEEEQA